VHVNRHFTALWTVSIRHIPAGWLSAAGWLQQRAGPLAAWLHAGPLQ